MNTPRLAATIVVLAQSVAHQAYRHEQQRFDGGGNDYEVLMVKRHHKARFVPNSYVFPGGGVDKEDFGEKSVLKEEKEQALYACGVAALRELAEESGAFLDERSTLKPVSDSGKGGDGYLSARRLTTLGRWVTPEGYAFRNDTVFFGAIAHNTETPPQTVPLTPQPSEIEDIIWISPSEALRLHRDSTNTFHLPVPTYFLLAALAKEKHLDTIKRLWERQKFGEADVVSVTQTVWSNEEGVVEFGMPNDYYCSLPSHTLLRDGTYRFVAHAERGEKDYALVNIGTPSGPIKDV